MSSLVVSVRLDVHSWQTDQTKLETGPNETFLVQSQAAADFLSGVHLVVPVCGCESDHYRERLKKGNADISCLTLQRSHAM